MKTLAILTCIFLILTSGCLSSSSDQEQTTDLSGNEPEICEWDWKWETTKKIRENTEPPQGYTYAVVTIFLKNNAKRSIFTNPWNWHFFGNGVKYFPDEVTYDDSIGHQTVELIKGDQITTKMVFLVRDDVKAGLLKYNGLHPPPMVRIKSNLTGSLPTFTS